ncbi:aminodeoxychorismate synthase component I [Proteinivorax tanatarense]|uniref:aminodeoxychorismate synthase n=1 Tax=Proteinivorax tanatarense TaxID=1260629 RepID=A0AAU7VJW1_9FIRM
MHIREVKTSLKSFDIYSIFKDKDYSFILDSGMDQDKLGRYSFIGFEPLVTFKSKGDKIDIIDSGKRTTVFGNPFSELKKLYSRYKFDYDTDLPFIGGFVGYLSYDLCHYIEKLPRKAVDDVYIPDCFMGLYDGVIVIDHKKNKVYVTALGINDDPQVVVGRVTSELFEGEKQLNNEEQSIQRKQPPSVSLTSNFTKDEYLKAVHKVKEYIKAGDIYQANLTQRFSGKVEENPYNLYKKLRKINPAPFASFINFGEGYVISSSPERFIKVKNDVIETRPIKGTRPRGDTPEEDIKQRKDLLSSEKDKAELLMIVDLERNDLSKVSQTGSVEVTELFHLEQYATVYHLVSTIKGLVKKECDAIDCIKATFPGGSITGAPKIRAMEIIDELEPTQRNIYTGSIGYIGLNGDMDWNIVIRTIVYKEGKVYLQVGGAIVWDSDAESEYQETFDKAKALIAALNS